MVSSKTQNPLTLTHLCYNISIDIISIIIDMETMSRIPQLNEIECTIITLYTHAIQIRFIQSHTRVDIWDKWKSQKKVFKKN